QDASNRFEAETDASMSVIYSPNTQTDLTLSYGLTHIYPSVSARSGFYNSGLTVLPNPDLKTQRDSISSLSIVRRAPKYTLYSLVFYDLIRNRATFVSVPGSPNASQYVNAPAVSVVGHTL